jgi:YD repeat-containing protein
VTLANGNSYTYDVNGNMTSRHVLEGTEFQDYTLFYDAENRLVEVKKNGNTAAQFTFDADGKRVKSVMDDETIFFVGSHYEVKNSSEITKYYMAGATRVAIRKYTVPQTMTVEYLLSDHPSTSSGHRLGSTSLTTDTSGAKVLELRYKACPYRVLREGEVRATWTSSPSTAPAYKMPLYQFTGQASDSYRGCGLILYRSAFLLTK